VRHVRAGGGSAGPQAQPLPASSCSPIVCKGSGSPKYLIRIRPPASGRRTDADDRDDEAIQFILSGAGWKAGAYTVGYQSCDDSTAQAGKWDSAKCSANAKRLRP
jgi:branched-chain amino acid transport system substrate-binding protein